MTPEPVTTSRRGFWIGFAIGAPILVYGIAGLIVDRGGTKPVEFVKWFVGADIAHDLLVVPAAGLVVALVSKLIKRPWRVPVIAALSATAVVVAVAWPALRGYGRAIVPDNSSVQPLNYATAVGTVVAFTWTAAAVWIATIWARQRWSGRG